ncbi:MAG: hypothetical protein IJV11_08015 [Muribaculaceae bacterium]|nr:hypothetical protein [Muribaculaceae bacterium]
MLRIWQEQITLLGVIDTGALLRSPKALPLPLPHVLRLTHATEGLLREERRQDILRDLWSSVQQNPGKERNNTLKSN